MGILKESLQTSGVYGTNQLLESVLVEYSQVVDDPYLDVLKAYAESLYEELVSQGITDPNTIAFILKEALDGVIYGMEVLYETILSEGAEDKSGVIDKIEQKASEIYHQHPTGVGAAAGVAGTLGAIGLYKLGKKVYQKIKNRKK